MTSTGSCLYGYVQHAGKMCKCSMGSWPLDKLNHHSFVLDSRVNTILSNRQYSALRSGGQPDMIQVEHTTFAALFSNLRTWLSLKGLRGSTSPATLYHNFWTHFDCMMQHLHQAISA